MARGVSRLVPDDDPGWVRFWDVFPQHVAKLDARKAWAALAPNAALVDRMVEALTWQAALWARQGYGMPYPASWLRAERWTDEQPCACLSHAAARRQAEYEPAFIPWESSDCPHIEAHDSKYRCFQATQLNRPRKVEAS
jgi:hypothetical protein